MRAVLDIEHRIFHEVGHAGVEGHRCPARWKIGAPGDGRIEAFIPAIVEREDIVLSRLDQK